MKISKAILKNSQSLLTTSLSLLALGQKYHAAHFAALCLEESTKCLMNIDSVKQIFKGKERNHFTKEKLCNFFHYLAGMLSVAYIMRFAIDKGILGDKQADYERFLDHLLKSSGMKGKAGLTECIHKYLKSIMQEKNGNKIIYTNNEIRKNSVYVDIEDGVLLTPNKRVKDKEIKQVIDDAKFAVSLMNMALYNNFSWLEFLESFPRIYQHPKIEAQKLVKSMRKKK